MKKFLALFLTALMLMTGVSALAAPLTGTYDLYVYGYEWGPALPYIIVEFDQLVDAASLDADDFSVVAHANSFVNGTEMSAEGDYPHTIKAVSLCTPDGGILAGEAGQHVRIDLEIHPDGIVNKTYAMGLGHKAGGVNVWYDGFTETITLAEGATLTSMGEAVESIEINPVGDVIRPEMDKWVLDQKFTATDGTVLNYATYAPAEDEVKNALIIWLHGAGECGTDSTIDLLCNESQDIAESPIQDYFGGAYVLAPQCDTMWMDDNDPSGDGNFYSEAGVSIYTESLQELIEAHVAANEDIDPNRVIIGGCSNGGFMTMNMIINYPGYYAAAYPICEAYQTEWITDEQIENLKKENIWFVHCLADPTVNVETTTKALVDKLGDLPNINVTYFDAVTNSSGEYFTAEGEPYVYNGHWVWVHALNDEVTNDGVSLWGWLAIQTK